jgi:biopolymer transport protein ExbB/TolQ
VTRFFQLARTNSIATLMVVLFGIAVLYFLWVLARVLRARVHPRELESTLKDLLERGKEDEALSLCESMGKPLTRVLSVALRTGGRREELADPLAEDIIHAEHIGFKRGLNRLRLFAIVIPVMGVVAPLPNFIEAVRSLDLESGVNRTLFAMGVSDALTFISAGLWMCILLVLGYAVLHFLVRKILYDMSESYLRFKSYLRSLYPEPEN